MPKTKGSNNQSQRAAPGEESLRRAIANRNEILASISFSTLFSKNILILERGKLVYERRQGLGNVTTDAIDLPDLSYVTASVGPILGTLHFTHTANAKDFPSTAGMFWRHDAIRMKRTIQGYIVALKRGEDYSQIPVGRLVPILIELGTDDASIVR